MAKDKNRDNNEVGGVKGIGVLIVILVIVTWLSVMALLIKCDVGGFGSQVLRPVFKDVPIINVILPDATDEEVAKESDYGIYNLQDALVEIASMDDAIDVRDAQIVALNDTVVEQQAEIERLRGYETEYTTFEEERTQFYNEIVYGESAPDTETYTEWYNTLDAENAERIYREILAANEADQEIKDLASAYESMDPKAAADILESMKGDLDTVALIMNNMSTDAQGDILAEMEPEYAALVTKKLLP